MRKLMACLVMVGCCHAAVAGDATSVPPVDSNTANLNTTKPGIAGVLAPLAGQTKTCQTRYLSRVSGTAYFRVLADGQPQVGWNGQWFNGWSYHANGLAIRFDTLEGSAVHSKENCSYVPREPFYECKMDNYTCSIRWD